MADDQHDIELRPHTAIIDGEEIFLDQYMIYLRQDGKWSRVGYVGAESGPINFIALDNEMRRRVAETINEAMGANPENKGGWRSYSTV